MSLVRILAATSIALGSLLSSVAHAQARDTLAPADSAPSPQGTALGFTSVDAPVSLTLRSDSGSPSPCTTPCTLYVPRGTYSLTTTSPYALETAISVQSDLARRFVLRPPAGSTTGLTVLTTSGVLLSLTGIILLSVGPFGGGLGAFALLTAGGVIAVVGLPMMIAGSVLIARRSRPTLTEQDSAAVASLRSRRVALLQTGAANPLSFAPSAASTVTAA